MSGLVAVWRRNGSPVASDELEAACVALDHRGPDGRDSVASADRILAHHHFWTTPEEVGERQPLSACGGCVSLAFDGRIDNREELARQLPDAGAMATDAELVARAFERWGEACFARLLGPFAVCLFDGRTGQALLARDPLGDRTLYYHLNDRLLVVASEEAGVLAHADVPQGIDDTTLARLYAVEAPIEGATLFREVRELPPGHLLAVTADRAELRPWWTFPEDPTVRVRSDREWAEAFLGLLRDAVRCRMRSRSPVGVMMSGGLDSTSVACLAGEELTRGGNPAPLRVFSWVFDELSCDERSFMDAVLERHGFESHRVVGDSLWPLADAPAWRREPPPPAPTPYRLLHESVWSQAHSADVEVLLSGTFGDELYVGGETWLMDIVRERRFATAAASVLACLSRRGPGGLWRDPGLRHVAGRALRAMGWRSHLRASKAARPWLTREGQELAGDSEADPGRRISTPWEARSAPLTLSMSSRHRVEVRCPYRDRRLVQFMTSVPGHQVYRGGLRKHVLREAMRGILPDRVRLQRDPTSYLPLYNRGFFEREGETVRSVLTSPDAWWPRFVRRDWVEAAIRRPLRRRDDGIAAAVPWLCVVIELWRRTAPPGGP
jgi:asparagine synthase (glutamine-hydrolysing)